MKPGGRSTRRITFALAVTLGAALLVKEAVVPGIARLRIVSAVRSGCESCELSLGAVRLHLSPPALSCGRARLTAGTPGATVVEAEAAALYVPVSLSQLLRGRIRAGIVELDKLSVTVKEGDLPSAPPPERGGARPPGPPLDLELEGVVIKDGAFVYVRDSPGRRGTIGISRLSAAAGPVGSSARLRGRAVEASAEGRLEDSGKFRLEVRGRPFAREPHLDVKLRVAGQELRELDRFLRPTEGIGLKGTLLESRSETAIRGSRLNSSVFLRYRGLELHMEKTKERGAVSSYIQTLLASAALGRQNADGAFDRGGTAELDRKPGETLVGFILRGLKEAAIQVAKQGGPARVERAR